MYKRFFRFLAIQIVYPRQHGGFTLIEMMVVVALIAVLASVGIPRMSSYIKRAEISEAYALSVVARQQVAGYYARRGRFPNNNAEAGLPTPELLPGKFVSTIDVEQGAVHLRFGTSYQSEDETKKGDTLSYRPGVHDHYPPGEQIVWTCGYALPVAGLTLFGTNRTNLPVEYISGECGYNDTEGNVQ